MDRIALVTGASRGIGRETARLLHRDGWQVIINYNRSADEALMLAEELNTFAIQADVAAREQVAAMFCKIRAALGEVNLLVNNAGIAHQALFQETSHEQWRKVFAVNVEGTMHCCQMAVPNMILRKQGNIINVSSVWGISGASCETAYSASKAAVIGLTKSLAKELGPSGIRVNCVAPGVIQTEMNCIHDLEVQKALARETPLGILGESGDIAELICFLASDKARFITGQVISPNGGFSI